MCMFWAFILVRQRGEQDEATGVACVRNVRFLPVLPVAHWYETCLPACREASPLMLPRGMQAREPQTCP